MLKGKVRARQGVGKHNKSYRYSAVRKGVVFIQLISSDMKCAGHIVANPPFVFDVNYLRKVLVVQKSFAQN